MIANDNLIAALEILELHCEQLQVRANILDHIAFGQKKKKTTKRQPPTQARYNARTAGHVRSKSSSSGGVANTAAGGGGDGWGIWKLFGFSSTAPPQQQQRRRQDQEQSGKQHQRARSPHAIQQQEEEEGEEEREEQTQDEIKNDNEPAIDDTADLYDEIYIDPELDLSAAVVFYSHHRIPRDVPGLPEVRNKLALRWGNDFATRAQDDDEPPVKLPEELTDRLRVRKAPVLLVEGYLKEIARSHKIPFRGVNDEDDDDEEEVVELEEDKEGGGLSLQPDTSQLGTKPESHNPSSTGSEGRSGGIPEMDELARRFAALKK